VQDLAVLPVAIASLAEVNSSAVLLKLLSLFDPSEPLFNQEGSSSNISSRRHLNRSSLLDYEVAAAKIPGQTKNSRG